jgi:hypothetical protein
MQTAEYRRRLSDGLEVAADAIASPASGNGAGPVASKNGAEHSGAPAATPA